MWPVSPRIGSIEDSWMAAAFIARGGTNRGAGFSSCLCAGWSDYGIEHRGMVFPRYVKDPKMTPRRKELLIYMLERIGREDDGKITIIFDCQSAGVRSLTKTREAMFQLVFSGMWR